MNIIRSMETAYTMAQYIFAHGASLNGYNFWTNGDCVIALSGTGDQLFVNGQAHSNTRFGTPIELATVVLFPERRALNDAIRSQLAR